ncbi:speckle targeted PIP5K1A-regulated poly(A) polymerase [Eurytemora carolleeae]|uniref:speckle targeted PIP5K1A-regulated poly(A) polymerase n=1 Tax=Eurytemora carolleeae TaxID=1294199 RepID=UPI000C78360B|nr:speckle targeted PIP5K1A-regulated poly(A) polymerase [Eurytemora carolleeae]|eukprot:XP_023345083.1 speckle targeted PIP5K1A-regulated poly(A) polymerase-like [Eurytemora affinis]
MGVFNSQFIKSCVNMDERFQSLFTTIKFLLKHQGLTGGGGDRINCNRFTSYAVTLMLIFYLQQLENPILPPVAEILELDGMDPEFNINGWIFSFSFENIVSVNKNLMSLEQLLTGFFEFYSTFYYEFIICPFFGTEITHESFKVNLKHLKWLSKDNVI